MNRILWTPLALHDLQSISKFLENRRDLATANRVCRTSYSAVQVLRLFPESGKAGLEEGTREFVVPASPAYVVVYRLASHRAVQVLRIWHAAQQRESEQSRNT